MRTGEGVLKKLWYVGTVMYTRTNNKLHSHFLLCVTYYDVLSTT